MLLLISVREAGAFAAGQRLMQRLITHYREQVSVCTCSCMCEYTRLCMQMHIFMCVCTHVCLHGFMCVCLHTFMYMFADVHVCERLHMFMFVFAHIRVCEYTHPCVCTIYACVSARVHVCACTHSCVCVCTHVDVCIHVCEDQAWSAAASRPTERLRDILEREVGRL